MNRIATTFSNLKAQGRKALIPYVTAGFPFADITPELMHAFVAGGADVIELGVPFSDPSADGPVIQKAGDKALALGIGMVQVLDMVRTFRTQDASTPVVLMGYANPVERYNQKHERHDGKSAFVADAAEAGVDGVVIVDYPPEECEDFAAELKSHGLDMIFLLAPTSTDERMQQVAAVASGYVSILPIISRVDQEICVGCGLCESLCPFSAIRVAETDRGSKAETIASSCKGCGICSASCPQRAIMIHHFTDEHFTAQIMELDLRGSGETG